MKISLIPIYGFIKNNSEKYFYIRDFMQNILGIIDSIGNLVVKYSYTAYGKYSPIGDLNLDKINPFKYKGYYYDRETNMYYCKSRYYVPEWCRWLNGDNPNYLDIQSINGMNLFVYCGNNPLVNIDEEGDFFFTALFAGAIIGGLVGMATSLVTQACTGDKTINWKQVALDATIGGISGLISATGIGVLGAGIASGALGFAGSVVGDLIESDGDWTKVKWGKAAIMGAVNGVLGAACGAGSQNSKSLGKSLLKNTEVKKTFGTLFKATNRYAAGEISKRGLSGTFNIYGKTFINSISKILPKIVIKATAVNLGKLSIATIVSKIIESFV